MGSISRQWSLNYPNTSANPRSIPRCSTSVTELTPTFYGQYFRFKTLSSYSVNEIINALMNKMNPKINPNNTYSDFHTNKCLFYSAVSRFIPYGPTDFNQWNIVIGMQQVIYFYDINHFNLDSNCLGVSSEKVTCEILDNEEIAIREARALRYIFGKKSDEFNIYVENTENFLKGYDELIDFRNFEVTWNNTIKSWKFKDLSTSRVININWFNYMVGSRILNKPKSFIHTLFSKFFHKVIEKEKVQIYTGKRHHLNRRRIYKTISRCTSVEPLPVELYYHIFIKYVNPNFNISCHCQKDTFTNYFHDIFKY